MKQIFYVIISFLFMMSCVPAQKYNDLASRKTKCETEVGDLRASNLELTTRNKELNDQMADLTKSVSQLKEDTNTMGSGMRRLQGLYSALISSYDKLSENNEKLLSSNKGETAKIINQLQLTQAELIAKEDTLKKLERELNARGKELDELTVELKAREAKMAELQNALSNKDSIVVALKKKVSDALVGFTNNGLTVTQKNGKVYVSLEERLLFATGSTVVDKEGIVALNKIGGVLEKNPDINVLIEGHTDNVPMKGNGEIRDNWDLSVMRATSVVKIITSGSKINPLRLTAAGRGEYNPVDAANTADARKKNRRIEIILTPKLDEILRVLETN